MENMTVPVAVSGLRGADKIRPVIYANHQLAHVPLTEILKLAVQAGQDSGAREEGSLPDTGGHFIRLGETLLIQYGFAAADSAAAENLINVRFPLSFAAADYYPCLCACAGQAGPAFTASIAAESLKKTGFSACMTPHSPQKGHGIFWLAIGLATPVF